LDVVKRLVKLGISLLVRGWDVLQLGVKRILGRASEPRCVVLYYHGIASSLKQAFIRQMDEAAQLAEPVAAGFNGGLAPGRRYFAVTFDDGFVSTLENAFPVLLQRRIPATIFIPTGSLGQRPAWVKNPASPAWNETVMTADQVRSLRHYEGITVGAHSVSHPNFQALEPAQAERELKESKTELETLMGCAVDLFSFPHGKYSAASLELAKAVGYRRVFSIAPEPAQGERASYVVGRVLVCPSDWPVEFRLKLLGAYRWMTWIQEGGPTPVHG